jgi:hypothetical protein
VKSSTPAGCSTPIGVVLKQYHRHAATSSFNAPSPSGR